MEKSFAFLKDIEYQTIEPALKESEISVFEDINNICLPDDYRYFLTHIGNGISFVTNGDNCERVIYGIKRSKLNKENKLLQKEFLFTKPFLHKDNLEPTDWFQDCINPEHEDEEICEQCKHFEKCPFAFVDSYFVDEYPYYSGVLPICYAGCTYTYFLILTGKHRGEIWFDNEWRDFIPSKQSFAEFLEWIVFSDAY